MKHAYQSALSILPGRLGYSLIGVAFSRALATACAFIQTLIIARTLGPEDAGLFFVALTLTVLFSIVAKAGLETAIQRYIGQEEGFDRGARIHGIYNKARHLVAFHIVAISGLGYLMSDALSANVLGDPDYADTLRILFLAIAPFSFLGLNAATLKALGKPGIGTFLEAAIWPTLTLALSTILLVVNEFSPHNLAQTYLAGATASALLSHFILQRSIPPVVGEIVPPCSSFSPSCMRLLGVELTNYALLWAPLLTLPYLASAEQAGLYGIAHRLAAQLALPMVVLAAITSPQFAAHFHHKRMFDMRLLAGRTTRRLIWLGMPIALILIIWSEQILSVFGPGFKAASTTLLILLLGQLFHLATGPTGNILAMTGHEQVLRNTLLATLVFVLILSSILIPIYGASGAAVAVTSAQVMQKIICGYLVAKYVQLPYFIAFAR